MAFIEAPYRKVDKETGIVTDEVVYMTADIEDNSLSLLRQTNRLMKTDTSFTRKSTVVTEMNSLEA